MIAGGNTGTSFTNRSFAYDEISGAVEELPSAPSALAAYSLVGYGDGILRIGGSYRDNWPTPVTDVDYYDPASRTWSQGPDLQEPTMWAQAQVVDDEVYIFGGYSATLDGPSGITFRFNPAIGNGAQAYQLGDSMPDKGFWAGGSAVVDGKIISFGGVNRYGEINTSAYEYDTALDVWNAYSGLNNLELQNVFRFGSAYNEYGIYRAAGSTGAPIQPNQSIASMFVLRRLSLIQSCMI